MDSLVQLLDANSFFLPILFGVLISVLIFGVMQGREVTIWPPKIGPKVSSPPKSTSTEIKSKENQKSDVGIIRYERDSHAFDDVKARQLRNASHEIWLIGATMHYTLSNSNKLIVEKVQKGVVINILLADPLGSNFSSSAHSFGQRPSILNGESKMSLIACRDILKQVVYSPLVHGKFNVKILDQVFSSGVYFYDPQQKNAQMILVPHISGHDAPISPGFLIEPSKSGLLDDYYGIYKSLWHRSKSLESWIDKHPEYLPTDESMPNK